MWMILQAEQPEDWVIATGKTTTVRDFVRLAFKEVGIELEFTGKGVNEKATVVKCTESFVSNRIRKRGFIYRPCLF